MSLQLTDANFKLDDCAIQLNFHLKKEQKMEVGMKIRNVIIGVLGIVTGGLILK